MVSLLEGKRLKSKELELAFLLRFQGVPADSSLETEAVEIDVEAGVQEKEKESTMKREVNIQMKGENFVDNGENVGTENEDCEKEDSTYSPITSSQVLSTLYPCKKCGKHFKSQKRVETHSKKHLVKEEGKSDNDEANKVDRPLCNVCAKSFRNKYTLKAHIKTHSMEHHKKSYDEDSKEKVSALCNLCSKLMTTNAALRKHMRHIHGESKSAKCFNCGKNLRMSCIKSHERRCRRSEEERKIICGECGKVLSDERNLKKHMRNKHDNNDLSEEMLQGKN